MLWIDLFRCSISHLKTYFGGQITILYLEENLSKVNDTSKNVVISEWLILKHNPDWQWTTKTSTSLSRILGDSGSFEPSKKPMLSLKFLNFRKGRHLLLRRHRSAIVTTTRQCTLLPQPPHKILTTLLFRSTKRPGIPVPRRPPINISTMPGQQPRRV